MRRAPAGFAMFTYSTSSVLLLWLVFFLPTRDGFDPGQQVAEVRG
jgi:hypothetical protein